MHPILSVEMMRIEHAEREARVRGARSSERPVPSRRTRRGGAAGWQSGGHAVWQGGGAAIRSSGHRR